VTRNVGVLGEECEHPNGLDAKQARSGESSAIIGGRTPQLRGGRNVQLWPDHDGRGEATPFGVRVERRDRPSSSRKTAYETVGDLPISNLR